MKNLLSLFFVILTLAFLSSYTTTRTFSTTDGSYDGMEIYTVKTPEKTLKKSNLSMFRVDGHQVQKV